VIQLRCAVGGKIRYRFLRQRRCEFGDAFYWIDFSNEGVSIVYNDEIAEDHIDEDLQAMLDEAQEGFVDETLDLGRVARGYIADAVAVRGNPLQDIAVLRTPIVVMKDGRIVIDRR